MLKPAPILIAILAIPCPLAAEEAMPPQVVVSAQDRMESLPQVAYNSLHDEYLVVWHDFSDAATPKRRILGRRFDRYGQPKSGPFVVSPAMDGKDRAQAAAAYDPVHDRYLVVYVYDFSGTGSDWDVRGRYIPWDGSFTNLADFPIGATLQNEWRPRVAYSPASETFLVVWWLEDPAGYASVHGSRVNYAGPTGDVVIADHPSQNRLAPDVAYQAVGNNFLVAYDSQADVFGKTVSVGGVISSEIGIAAWPGPESEPAVAACANWQFVVVWRADPGIGTNGAIYARFLYGDGTVYSGAILIYDAVTEQRRPEIACLQGGIDYLVAFENEFSTSQFGISGTRISATQDLRPPFGIRNVAVGETGVTFHPAVAGGDSGWFAAWEYERQGTAFQDIYARAVGVLFEDGFETGATTRWSSVRQ